ncbi:hypothetical protein ACFWIQ_10300 [Kitasatospora sp. NPDC127059]|uniref:hypothetical protein n=1 Tax=unclassified Kitasatospora TaxID=2633591 RepID=UPI00364EB20A
MPKPGPKVVQIKQDNMRLDRARSRLAPTLDELRRIAQGLATKHDAQLFGIVIHVDMDGVTNSAYEKTRDGLCGELQRAFTKCNSALALAASEMEAWLMLFPDAFPKTKSSWKLNPKDARRDLGMIADAKKHLETQLRTPQYEEKHAPSIMEQAAKHKLVTPHPAARNSSYTAFVKELDAWS